MNRVELSEKYFKMGYNCSQSVVLSFKDLINLSEDEILKLSSPFGGGMGRLRETCGALSGAFIVLGLLYGYSTPFDQNKKAELYKRVQDVGRKFEEVNGSIVCRVLLNLDEIHSSSTPTLRSDEFYTKRPCLGLIKSSVEILDNYIKENKIDN